VSVTLLARLLRRYVGAIKALLRLYEGAMTELSRRYSGICLWKRAVPKVLAAATGASSSKAVVKQ
jgi:hypothetical protein